MKAEWKWKKLNGGVGHVPRAPPWIRQWQRLVFVHFMVCQYHIVHSLKAYWKGSNLIKWILYLIHNSTHIIINMLRLSCIWYFLVGTEHRNINSRAHTFYTCITSERRILNVLSMKRCMNTRDIWFPKSTQTGPGCRIGTGRNWRWRWWCCYLVFVVNSFLQANITNCDGNDDGYENSKND